MQPQKKKQEVSNCFDCPICYQSFSQVNRYPRVLQCGHTICQKCIILIIGKKATFTCPLCQTKLGELRIALTYRNYSLTNLMELNGIKSKANQNGQLSFTIIKMKFQQIVNELVKAPKHVTSLTIKRLRDEKENAFDQDLVRSNKHSMRFFKLLIKFYRLKKIEIWVKFSFYGFEECLAESLYEMEHLTSVKVVNAYDQFGRNRDLISLVGKPNIAFEIVTQEWKQ